VSIGLLSRESTNIMFVSEEFILVLGQCPIQWAQRYNLDPPSYPCENCGALRTPSIPFFKDQFRGLLSAPCKCGNLSRTPYCLVRDPKYGDLFSGG
jgi:hypothetical protein